MADICCLAELGETNILGVLTEALTADVHAILADQTTLIRADTAAERQRKEKGRIRNYYFSD